jgi:tRNA 2-thiouridine synthesizing protein A
MTSEKLNTIGLKCPMPVMKLAVKAVYMKSGDILELWGDCPTFERDVRVWCERLGRLFLSVNIDGDNRKIIQIRF